MNRTLRRLSLMTAVTGSLALAGCGFTPLYAVPGVSPGLASIEVHAPHGRTAFLLAEDLDRALARDRSASPIYRLDFTVTERRYPRGLTINNVASLYESHVNVSYRLTDLATGRLIKAGAEPIQVVYDVGDQPYAGVVAQQDSQQRAADEAAQRIRTDLAAYFAGLARKE
jgi:LPS-assembly lipoprotein